MGEAVIDERARIVIPGKLRAELKLRRGQKLRIERRGRDLVLHPAVNPEDFIRELKGCVPKSKVDLEELKSIWGVGHAHS